MDSIYHGSKHLSILSQHWGIHWGPVRGYDRGIMDIDEIRRRNLAFIVQTQYGGVDRQFGLDVGLSASYVSRIFSKNATSKRAVGSKLARRIEKAMRKPSGWLDTPQWEAAKPDDNRLLVSIIQSVENSTKDIELDDNSKAELIASLFRLLSTR